MRVTDQTLRSQFNTLNGLLGRPLAAWTVTADAKTRANVGNFHSYHCLGVWAVHEMANEDGGVTILLSCGTRRELSQALQHLLLGIRLGQKKVA